MLKDEERGLARWQIYQVDVPGIAGTRYVVAHSLQRALAIGLRESDTLSSGQPLIAWNITGGFLQSSPVAARHTWSLLGETREGVVDYDREEGWYRLDMA